jgi:tripartite-type tricarboxylate transporter receptor subunit TctC
MMVATLLLFTALCFATSAFAQYPSRPITIIVPIPPGGAPDIAARVIAQKLSENVGQAGVVENRVGANGNIANELVVRSRMKIVVTGGVIRPQSYELVGPLATGILRELTLDMAWRGPFVRLEPVATGEDFSEFIEYAKKANPPLAYAWCNGSQHHPSWRCSSCAPASTHVPYKGGSPAAAATVAGETAAVWSGSSNAPQIKAGRLRPLAVSGAHRSAQYPELPTIAEFYPGFENSIWLGLFGPAGIPEPTLAKLRSELKRVLETPDVKQRLNAAGGLDPYVASPDEFAALIKRDYAKFAKLVKDINLKVD